ncbi:uncharacterized protein LOC143347188 [Colletes latitarsis]|uniref:uncharacterized protein LOC143347188 n=1 Tax=Colletes latitarsis TaxID=2605962 RepID=UPI0040375754
MAASQSAIGENTDTSLRWELVTSAFKCRIQTGVIYNTTYIEPIKFMQDAEHIVLAQVEDAITEHSSVKVNIMFVAIFKLEENEQKMYFNTTNCDLYVESNLSNWYKEHVMDRILAKMEEFQCEGSGWKLHAISHMSININKYNPLRVGCCVEVPKIIRLKKAVVNVKSDRNDCFFRSVIAGLYPPTGNVSKPSSYPDYKDVLKTKDFEISITLKQIEKFEKDNDISVNVYGWKEEKCVVLRLTPTVRKNHVRLLMLQDQKTPPNNHFVCIKNLSRLISSQASKNQHRIYICDRCLHYFISETKLDTHIRDCKLINKCAITLPTKKDKWLKFKNYARKERVPFVVYVDIECMLENIEPEETKNPQQYQRHKPFNVGYYVHCSYDKSLCVYKSHRDIKCVTWFAKEMFDLGQKLEKKFNNIKAMSSLTPEQSKDFLESTNCHICKKPFSETDERVQDHCHLTGAYRGPAHKGCNLNYKKMFFVPVVAHNMSGYDCHFLIEEFANAFKGQMTVLAITNEKYKSFEKKVDTTKKEYKPVSFRFIDSLNFLNSSLDNLSSYLEKDHLTILRNEFRNFSDDKFDLLTRKGVFPYDYVSSYEKLSEKHLPSREQFKDRLNDTDVSEDDYDHALKVWKAFNVSSLGMYSDLYLKTDVLLLVDVFENFRNNCIQNYKLDPAHYYTLPGFTWDAMLKYTDVELELITDIDMFLFVEKGIRGGLSQCSHRQAEANNKYLPETYKRSEPSTYLMYYDMNNMYGSAMSEPLPYRGFRWLKEEELKNFNVKSISKDGTKGYLLEVDLVYLLELHDKHADLPFCPLRDKPPGGGLKNLSHAKKLLATVYDKERYVIHYRYLQQCLQHGLRIKRIHRVLEFEQSRWLSKYIELNTRLRVSATNKFQQNLFKLMNNAIYGKTIENVRKYVNVKLVTRWDGRYGAEDYISRPNFHSVTIFSENFVAITLKKLNVVLNKPIYVGMCVLDISKMQLYSFHYDFMAKELPGKCKILYTDTDSLIYELQCEDAYDVMKNNLHWFDTSNYKRDNQFNMPLVHEKEIGLMKDENGGKIMTTFVGLKAKVYSIRVNGVNEDIKKIKGIKRKVVKTHITHEDFLRYVDDDSEAKSIKQNTIRSKRHCVYSVSEKKQALSSYDDKRYIVPNSKSTLPWGHKDIPEIQQNNDS